MATTSPDQTGLTALTAAVEKHAKLELLATQLPERLAQARAEVADAYRALGLAPPSRGGSTQGSKRAANGEVEDAVLFALPGTLAEVSEASGRPSSTVSSTLARLCKKGTVVATGELRRQVYHRAGEAPDEQ